MQITTLRLLIWCPKERKKKRKEGRKKKGKKDRNKTNKQTKAVLISGGYGK